MSHLILPSLTVLGQENTIYSIPQRKELILREGETKYFEFEILNPTNKTISGYLLPEAIDCGRTCPSIHIMDNNQINLSSNQSITVKIKIITHMFWGEDINLPIYFIEDEKSNNPHEILFWVKIKINWGYYRFILIGLIIMIPVSIMVIKIRKKKKT